MSHSYFLLVIGYLSSKIKQIYIISNDNQTSQKDAFFLPDNSSCLVWPLLALILHSLALTWLAITAQNYPYMLGGKDGVTSFNAFDIDSDTDCVIAGGKSSDPTIVTELSPILAYICSNSAIQWVKQLPSNFDNVWAVNLNADHTRVLVSLNKASLTLAWAKVPDGSIINSYEAQNGGYKGPNRNGILVSADNHIYLAMQTTDEKWSVAKVKVKPDDTFETVSCLTLNNPSSQASSLVFGNNQENIFVGSSSTNGQTGAAEQFYRGLTKLNSDLSVEWIERGQVSNLYETRMIGYTYNDLFVCADPITDDYTKNLLFTKYGFIELQASSVRTGTFQLTHADGALSCQGIYVNNHDDVALLISEVNSGQNLIVKLYTNWFDNFLIQSNQILKSFSSNQNMVKHAIFTSVAKVVYVGSAKKVHDAAKIHQYIGTAGFVMTLDDTESCITDDKTNTELVVLDSLQVGSEFLEQADLEDPQSLTLVSKEDVTSQDLTLNDEKQTLCQSLGFKEMTQDNIKYQYDQGIKSYPITSFSTGDSSVEEADIAYEAALPNQAVLPSWLVYDDTAKEFIIQLDGYTIDEDEVHDVELTGILPNGQFATTQFTITLQRCSLAQLTPSTNDEIVYHVGASQKTKALESFETDISDCLIEYQLVDTEGVLDNQVISFDPEGLELSVFTEDADKAGDYKLGLKGTLNADPDKQKISEFTLTVIYDPCYGTQVQSDDIEDQIFDVSQPQSPTIMKAQWVQTNKDCSSSISYHFTMASGEDIDYDIFTVNESSLEVQTTDFDQVNRYHLQLCARVDGYPSSEATKTFIVDIVDSCGSPQINGDSIASREYVINGQDMLIISFDEFSITAPAYCNQDLKYTAALDNGDPLPGFIDFNGTKRTFKILSTDSADKGDYIIRTTAEYLHNRKEKAFVDFSLSLYVNTQKSKSLSNQPPYFKIPPMHQIVTFGKPFAYELPKILDIENDEVRVHMDVGAAFPFLELDEGVIRGNPEAMKVGNYSIKITLNDSSPQSQPNVYFFTLQIKPAESIEEDAQQRTVTPSSDEKEKLEASIRSISSSGVLILQFSKELLVPDNYQSFNDSVLQLSVVKGYYSKNKLLDFSWSIVDWQAKTIEIQLKFDNPLKVSYQV